MDSRTLAFVAMLAALTVSFLGLLIWSTRKTYPGFAQWTFANLALAAAIILFSLRGRISDLFTLVLAHLFCDVAGLLYIDGVRAFRGWKPFHAIRWAAALELVILVYFRYRVDNLNMRVVVASLFWAAGGFLCMLWLLRRMPVGRQLGLGFTAMTFGLFALSQLAKTVQALFGSPYKGIFDAADAGFYALFVIALLMWSFGFLLMSNERLVMELRQTQQASAHVNRELQMAAELASDMAARAALADAAKPSFWPP